jgi:hypothetical protein
MTTWSLLELLADPSLLGGTPGAIEADAIAELRHELDDRCSTARTLDPSLLPIRLPKQRVADVLACEGFGRDGLQSTNSDRLILGRIADMLLGCWVGGHAAVCDTDTIVSLLTAHNDAHALTWWEAAPASARARVVTNAVAVVEGFVGVLGSISPTWSPRPQTRAAAGFAGGAVICSAAFDLELGSSVSARAIIDVKTGTSSGGAAEHADELYFYALLAALRDGRAPDFVATWYTADRTLDPRPVSLGVLQSAAMRTGLAVERIVELAQGRDARLSPGWRCNWCAHASTCAVAGTDATAQVTYDSDLDEEEGW